MATFVHNEPTSLTIIQEIGLPEAFYKVVESGVEPAFEVHDNYFYAIAMLNCF
jgi:E3 ubiquitin-protein ligase HUWE1